MAKPTVISPGGALLGVVASFGALYFVTRDVRRGPDRPRRLPTRWPRPKSRRGK